MNIIRPSNAYAPGQQLYRILPRAVVCGLSGKKLPLHGGGQSKKVIYPRDEIWHMRSTLWRRKLSSEKLYNVGPKDPVAVRQLIELAATEMKVKFETLCDVTPPRFGEDWIYWLDSSAIAKDLGWKSTDHP